MANNAVRFVYLVPDRGIWNSDDEANHDTNDSSSKHNTYKGFRLDDAPFTQSPTSDCYVPFTTTTNALLTSTPAAARIVQPGRRRPSDSPWPWRGQSDDLTDEDRHSARRSMPML